MNNVTKAFEYFKKALITSSDHVKASVLIGLGNLCMDTDSTDQAIVYYEKSYALK